MHRAVAALVVLTLGLAPAGVAQAQFGAPNVPTPLTEPTPEPPPREEKFEDEGLSTLQKVLIFGSAGVVLGLVGMVIVRDARKAAPVDRRARKASPSGAGATGTARGAASPGTAGSSAASTNAARARERQQAKRAKAKAKAVRQQRKRNRPN